MTVLRAFQIHFLRGRLLDLQSDSIPCAKGRTTEIFVSRSTLFQDAMDELTNGVDQDRSTPLEVTFNGESAEDYGGPRREFLSAMVREIRDRLFRKLTDGDVGYTLTDDVAAYSRNHYFGAGLVFGKFCFIY